MTVSVDSETMLKQVQYMVQNDMQSAIERESEILDEK